MNRILLLCMAMCLSASLNAQTNSQYTEKDYARHPLWIKMISDPNTNYFEAEKAYKIYFQHHPKPEGEHDVIGEHEAREKRLSKRERQKIQADNRLRLDVKKYEHWHMKMQPYVQSDGRILSTDERLQIWKEQQATPNK
ncbi:MAG: hypothetical protein WCG87_04745 [Bacteroidota bacterium]